MPKGTYEKRGLIRKGSGPGLTYVKSPGGALRKASIEERKAQKAKKESESTVQRAARKYVGSEDVKGNAAREREALAKKHAQEIREYVRKTRNK